MSHPFQDTFARQRARLLEMLRKLSFERRSVTLSSGKPSDFYIDVRQTVLTAEGHFLTGQLLYALLEQHAPQAEAIGGMTLGADPLASAVSLVSFIAGRPRHAFYVRKEPKGHGTKVWIEGAKSLHSGMPVVVVEDVITTGGSALRAIERAHIHELKVVHVLAVVDRDEEGGHEAIGREAPVTALFTRGDFLAT
jgi:orotate phosphoribosyltransferase